MRLDTLYTINTPEGIALSLSPAGIVPRTLAWFIDLLIRGAINLIIITSLVFVGEVGGLGIALIIFFFLEWFYPVWFEVYRQGQTPGKRLLGLYVAHTDASPISFSASMIRNLLRVVDFMPLLYGFGLLSALFTQKFQRLGDLAADTVVLHQATPHIVHKDTHESTQAQRPPYPLTLEEQQALVQFSQRTTTLTHSRCEELAQLSGALINPNHNKSASEQLISFAHWITGKSA